MADNHGIDGVESLPSTGVVAGARLAAIVDGSEDAILVKDCEARITDWNAAAERLYGYAAADVIGRPVAMLVPADRAGEELRILDRVLAGERVEHYETERLRADGTRVAVSLTVSPLRDDNGRIVGASSSARDITRRRAEAVERDRLASLVDASADAIVSLSPEGIVLSWNRAAHELFGIGPADAVGRRVDQVVSVGEAEAKDRRATLARVIGSGETVRFEVDRVGAAGSPVKLLVTMSPVRDRDGTITAACVICRDVTDQQQTEHRLREAQRMEAVGRLAGGIAHDFNNLLTVIKGFTGLAQKAIGDGPGAGELDEVQNAAGRAAQLTRRLLEFSRRRVTDPVPVDLSDVVDSVTGMLRSLIGEQIEVVALHDEQRAHTLVDRAQIEQVLVDLAVNARDAMPDGGALTIETNTITLGPGHTDEAAGLPAGRYACLTVTDTGVGIDPETIDHLFEPFFTTKDVGAGTGLGLASVHGIVSQAGGVVRVYSEPGLGAAFKVYLPALEDSQPPAADAREERRPARAGRGETVLVCEDEDALRRLLVPMLRSAGYVAIAAATPAQALDLFAGGLRPHVLISDVVMPGMSGPELVDRLGEHDPQLPVLFISGYTRQVTRSRTRLPAGSEFLGKPFSAEQLLEALGGLLDRDGARVPD